MHEWVTPYPLLGARSLTTPFAPVVAGGFLVHANPGTVHALDWPHNFSRVDSLFIQNNLPLDRSPVVARELPRLLLPLPVRLLVKIKQGVVAVVAFYRADFPPRL